MSQFRFAHIGLLLAAIGLNTMPAMIGATSVAYAAGPEQPATLRPEVGKPLQAAQALMKAKKYKEALAKINETDSISGKTPNETFTIARMRASAAASAGDNAIAAKAFEAVIESGRLPADQQLKYMQTVGGLYYQAKDYPKAAMWLSRYLKVGGEDPAMHTLLNQTYFLSGDYAHAVKEVTAQIQADEKAGRTPTDEQLQLLASCAIKQNDKTAYINALEKLVAYHPKKEYWTDLLIHVQSKPGFADRLSLDVYRLKQTLDQLTKAGDYMEMSQLSLQAGFPAEAVKVIEQGYKSGTLGTGSDAERHKRLRDLASKSAASDQKAMAQNEVEALRSPDGTGLVNLGYAYVTTGQFDKGIALMEQGIKQGGMKHLEDAKLHLGVAYLLSNQKKKAVDLFKTVQGTDGTADLARLWVIYSQRTAT